MNALGRLLAVGSEWVSYATLVPTGGARKAARAAADEASEQLRRHGARQASRELKPVVIGEDMVRRVKPYAKQKGYLTIEDFIPETVWHEAFARGEAEALALNRQWIMQMMG